MTTSGSVPKRTPLYDKHVQAGARMVSFAGWLMPVQYTGIIEEHLHTREHFEVLVDGTRAGEVTSAAFSPCLKKGIGLCYIDGRFAVEGQPVSVKGDRVEISAVIRDVPILEEVEE